MDLVFCCCFLLLGYVIAIRVLFGWHRGLRLPPGPLGLPIIGHLHLIHSKPLHQAIANLASRYGPIMHLRLGSRPVVVVSSPAAVEECFTRNDIVFANRPRTVVGDVLTYDYSSYIWAPYGSLWRILRRLTVVEVFSSNSLLKYSAIREEEVRGLVQQVYGVSRKGSEKVELKYLSSLFAFNVMLRIVVGRRLVEWDSALKDEGRRVYGEFKEKFRPGSILNLCDFLPILRWIGYKGLEKEMRGMHKIRDELVESLIAEVRGKRGGRKGKGPLMETLVWLQESDPEFYTGGVVKSLILIMFVAGTETTTTTIEWAMSNLLNNPAVLEKVQKEIDEVVGKDRLVCDSDLATLPYLRWVVYETLRLCPPVPLLVPHLSSRNCTIGEYEIPGGTILLVNVRGMHRDPAIWEEAEEFRPERFEGVEGERDGSKFIPFGMGRRACPGAAVGLRMVSLALAALLQCYHWKPVDRKVDAGATSSLLFAKAVPLEAICTPRHHLPQFLSQL